MKWVKRNNVEIDEFDLIIDSLCKVRGIEDISTWINPTSKHLHSPYALMNIDALVEELIKAIHKDMNVVIVADIDADGICSTAIMYRYLRHLTPNVRYIHAQRSKGHGVETVLDQIIDEDEIVLIVDSSSNSIDGCKALVDQGKKVLIIDHHQLDVENEYALIVNCQMGDYENKSLSGSAMCLKVCQVIDDYLDLELAEEFYDLSAVGLVADMMNVSVMENRYLINKGLNNINNSGIAHILTKSNIDFKNGITSTNISFKIAPIIGACSRFDKIELALELLTTDDEDRIAVLTKEMIEMNEKRKTDQKALVEEIVADVDDSNNIIVIIDNNIDSGFKGLLATEIVQRFSKPVFVLSEVYIDGELVGYTGSARSIGLIKLKEMCQDSGLFNFATGHSSAHGVGFNADKTSEVIDYFNTNLNSDDLQNVAVYDLELDINEVDGMDIKEIEKFSRIVGQGFPEPKFLITGVMVEEAHTKKLGNHVRAVMGKNLDTVKINCENNFNLMKFRSNESYGREIETHFNDDSNFFTELKVIGSLNINKFYNFGLKAWVISNQIFIDDFEIVR